MKALVTTSADVPALIERAIPSPRANEVLVRLTFAGICRTDLQAASGKLQTKPGTILGHEGAGLVDNVPVTLLPRTPCSKCALPPLECEEPERLGVDRDGVFAEWVCVPKECVLTVPFDSRRAAYVEPVAAALAVVPAIPQGSSVLVEGDNRIAELTRRILRRSKINLIEEGLADVAIETTTDVNSLLPKVRRGGRIIVKSRPATFAQLDLAEVVEREITLVGARYASFRAAIDLLTTLAIDDLLGPSFPLEQWEAAFARARAESVKPFFEL